MNNNPKGNEFLGYIALQHFMDSHVEELSVTFENGCSNVKIAGDTFGLLGACAIAIKIITDSSKMTTGGALSYIETLLPMIDRNSVKVPKEFVNSELLDDFIKMFTNRKNEEQN